MASAVNEVSKLLGLPTDNVPDDLKSPEQHQASMFAARQQLHGHPKGESSSFTTPGSSQAVKKVAAIKPQFKALSKKSNFVTPFRKTEEKEVPEKMSPHRKPTLKQVDRLRDPGSPGDIGGNLPTVSSRYLSPAMKRSRGRHQDEVVPSDDETKSKLGQKKFTSPERSRVAPASSKPSSSPRASSKPSPSPRASPKVASPRRGVNTDESDRQKVNDFFSNKFGISVSTPKGADRPKPVLTFSRKDEQDSEYNTVQSPGKFKSTFKALGNGKDCSDEEEDDQNVVKKQQQPKEERKGATVDKKPTKAELTKHCESSSIEKKTKRKIERSPKRARKVASKHSPSFSAYSTSGSSDDSETEECTKKARPKKAVKPTQQRTSRDQNVKVKQEKMKAELSRKRKKVYSSSDSSETDNEFTLSCANSDNTDSIWVQCDSCNKWRYLRGTLDPNLIPEKWLCSYNPDRRYNKCNAPEENGKELQQGFEFVYSKYNLGSLVWCKMQGYPWWPGMIDNDPLTKTFYYKHANSQLPDKYHVTFFGIQATRAWIGKKFIKVYNPDSDEDRVKYDQRKSGKGMREAIAMANQAFHLEVNDRKKIYGFREQCKDDEAVCKSSSKESVSVHGKKSTNNKELDKPKIKKEESLDPADKLLKKMPRIPKIKHEKDNRRGAVKKKCKTRSPTYISQLYQKAVLKLSQEAQATHSLSPTLETSRGRGRPRKDSTASEKNTKKRKTNKRPSTAEESYIPSASSKRLLDNYDVIENIENEIENVLRDCSPSPTSFSKH